MPKVKEKKEKNFNWTDVYGSKKPEGNNFTDKDMIHRFLMNKKKTLKDLKEED